MASEIVKYQPIVRAGEIQVGPSKIPTGQIRTFYPLPNTSVVRVITRGGMGAEGEDITLDFLLETAERVDQFVADILAQKILSVSVSDGPLDPPKEESKSRPDSANYVICLDGNVIVRTKSGLEPLRVFRKEKEDKLKGGMPFFISLAKVLKKIDRFSEVMDRCQAIFERELNRQSPKTEVETEILRNSIGFMLSAQDQISPEEDTALDHLAAEEFTDLQTAVDLLSPDFFSEEQS